MIFFWLTMYKKVNIILAKGNGYNNGQIRYRCSKLTDCNLVIRMLFADSYWCCCFTVVLSKVSK